MNGCRRCARVRGVLSQFWDAEQIDEIFDEAPIWEPIHVVTEKDIEKHNQRIEWSALEPIALPRKHA